MKIDYYYEYPVDDAIKDVVMEVLEGRVHYAGKYTDELESGVANTCGVTHGVSANSATSVLLMTLHALGIGPGDEVIVPANSYVANAECVIHRGARPVFVDCDLDTSCINVDAFEAAVGPKTKAVIVVHNYGHPADVGPIVEISRKHGIKVIENACHALGALYKGQPVGSIGDVAFVALSHKLLSVCGMGGVLVTRDGALADTVNELRHHGRHGLHEHEYAMSRVGYNFRLNEMQAAIGTVQLKSLEAWNDARRANAAIYTHHIQKAGLPIEVPVQKNYATPVYLHYVVRVADRRDELKTFLNEQGIEAKIHYPLPNHLQQPIIDTVGRQGPFPAAERSCAEVLSLPCDPGMNESRIHLVVDTMRQFFT
jgi:dTDP-4-amino-4,6-dideoxygalactose transaminase